jgi:hypothetical protein
VIGIDLGMTYSWMAVWQHDRVEIVSPKSSLPSISPCFIIVFGVRFLIKKHGYEAIERCIVALQRVL